MVLKSILKSSDRVWNVQDAGTAGRFLTAVAALSNDKILISGSERMNQRPMKELFDALRNMGAEVDEQGIPDHLPAFISGGQLPGGHVRISGNISSQFFSALMLIAPSTNKGLLIETNPPIVSQPYIGLTASLMTSLGLGVRIDGNTIAVDPIDLNKKSNLSSVEVEGDWSAAAFWYALVSLSDSSDLTLEGLSIHSKQGDKTITNLGENFGVKTKATKSGIKLSKQQKPDIHLKEIDFTDCPDLALPVIVALAASKVSCKIKGVETLALKESDRMNALSTEIGKFGVILFQTDNLWSLKSEHFSFPKTSPAIKTYGDHRMAMSFAPLALLGDIIIENPEVVNKSYPGFWDDLLKCSFETDR